MTDPERYRVVHARAQVWAEVLSDLLGADVSTVDERLLKISSDRPLTLYLLLQQEDLSLLAQSGFLPRLTISVSQPDVEIASVPDCGCDACDYGSQDLLDHIDATVARVVGGPFVALRGEGWHADWSPDGSSAGASAMGADLKAMVELCRRIARDEDVQLPPGTAAYVGRSWIA